MRPTKPVGTMWRETFGAWNEARIVNRPTAVVHTVAEIISKPLGVHGTVYRKTADGSWVERRPGEGQPSIVNVHAMFEFKFTPKEAA